MTQQELQAYIDAGATKAERLGRALSAASRRLTGRPDPEPTIPSRENDVLRFTTVAEATAAAAPTEAIIQDFYGACYRVGLAWGVWNRMTGRQRKAFLAARGFDMINPNSLYARLGA